MLEADLPVDPPVQFGSMQAYALCSEIGSSEQSAWIAIIT
jgi:hypothetical protein